MKKIGISTAKEALARFLQEARKEQVVITRHGRPVGVLIGFASEEECLEFLMENDPAFLKRIARARQDLRAGLGTRLEDIQLEMSCP